MTTGTYDTSTAPEAPATFSHATYWDTKSDAAVFANGENRVDQLEGFFDAIWKEWDDGNADHHIDPGYRLRLRLVGRDGRPIVIRSAAKVFVYSLVAKLADVHKGEFISVRIRAGTKNTKTSFPDLSVWRETAPGRKDWVSVRGTELDASGDRFEEAMALIETFDTFVDPPKKVSADDTVGLATAEAAAKGWPAICIETEDLYLELIAEAAGGESFDSLNAVTEPAWGMFRQWMAEQTNPPSRVERWLKRMGAKGQVAESLKAQAPESTAPPKKDPFE